MSNEIQSLDSIAPMEKSNEAGSNDPTQKEYEEGKKFLENKEYGQAAVCLHNALVEFQEKNDDNGIANASNQLGNLCLEREDFEKALPHYERAFEICDKSNDRMSILAILHNVVDAYRGLKSYDNAVETCLDILDLYQDNRDPQGTVQILEKVAEIYLADGKSHKAADTYRTISSIHKNFDHPNIAKDYLAKAEELES